MPKENKNLATCVLKTLNSKNSIKNVCFKIDLVRNDCNYTNQLYQNIKNNGENALSVSYLFDQCQQFLPPVFFFFYNLYDSRMVDC